jgi:dTDP-4-amino-4,6-dideoxygalactose transaminase
VREADVQAVLEALKSGWLTMGPGIQAFEAEFATYVGAPLAVAVSSGTSALHLAVRAVVGGGGHGGAGGDAAYGGAGSDAAYGGAGAAHGAAPAPGLGASAAAEVLVPAIGGGAAAAAVRAAGAVPVFCDVVSPEQPTLDPVDAAARITERTKAAVAVHAYGFVCATDLDVPVIEDARGALGTGVGHGGVAACWSFADGRVLGMGEGGMVTTGDEALAARVRLLRQHAMTSGTWDRHRGHSDSYDVVDIGFNFRLDEPRAALGSSLLSHLDEDLRDRPLRTAFVVEDVDGVIGKLSAAGLTAGPARPLADLPRAAEAARRLVVLAPGSDARAASQAL